MLFGLMSVVAPLCVAIFYTVETLDELARQSQTVNQQTITLTRSSQHFESSLIWNVVRVNMWRWAMRIYSRCLYVSDSNCCSR